MTTSQFHEQLLAYLAWSRGSHTGGLRSPERNKEVGGHPHSYHMTGLAGDVGYWPNPTPDFLEAKKRAEQLGLRLIREDDHDHLQPL